MTDQPKAPFHARSRITGSLIGVVGFALFLIVSHFVGEGRGTIVSATATCLGLVVCVSWPLRKELWFWVAMGVLTCVHTLAIVFFDSSAAAEWTGLTLMPVMWIDVGLMLSVILLLYRRIYGAPPQLVEDTPERYGERDIDL